MWKRERTTNKRGTCETARSLSGSVFKILKNRKNSLLVGLIVCVSWNFQFSNLNKKEIYFFHTLWSVEWLNFHQPIWFSRGRPKRTGSIFNIRVQYHECCGKIDAMYELDLSINIIQDNKVRSVPEAPENHQKSNMKLQFEDCFALNGCYWMQMRTISMPCKMIWRANDTAENGLVHANKYTTEF